MVARLLVGVALAAAGTLALSGSVGHAGACPCITPLPGLREAAGSLAPGLTNPVAAADPTGGVVVAGISTGDGPTKLVVARYLPDGSLDPSFGVGGVTFVRADEDLLGAVAVYGDHRIVVAGVTFGGGTSPANVRFAVTRLLPDGSLDLRFGTGGTATVQVGHNGAAVDAAETLPNGDVVVAGGSPPNNGQAAIAIFRVDDSGLLDQSFGKGGVVSWTLPEAPPNATGMVFAAAFDQAARILVCGEVPIPVPDGQPLRDATLIARYLPDGTPDPSFGDNGMVVDKAGPPATDVAALSDGSVVSSAEAYAANTGTVSLTRYARDGKVVSSENIGTFPEGYDQPALAAFADGSTALLIDVGQPVSGQPPVADLVRIAPDGTRMSDARTDRTNARLVALPDGSVVTVAWQEFHLERFRPDGTRDPAFVTNPPSFEASGAKSLAVDASGHAIITAGWAQRGGRRVIELARFLQSHPPGSALDATFGSGGLVDTAIGSGDAEATTIARLPNGRLLVAGGTGSSGVLLRYLPTGQLDPAYGEGGRAADPPWPARAIAVTSGDGDAYVAGGGFSVARFDTVGRLDTSFGTSGTSTPLVGDATVTALALQSGGRILLAGTRAGASVVARLRTDGSLDPSFGNDGVATGPAGGATAIAVTPDDRVVMATDRFAVVRLLEDGALDPSFGVGGVARPPVNAAHAGAIAVQPDGAVVVGGSDSTLTRLDSFGYLDETWGSNYGLHGVTTGPPGSQVTAVGLGSDSIVTAGTVLNGGRSSTVVSWLVEGGALAPADGLALGAVHGGQLHSLTQSGVTSPALSPDGTAFAYIHLTDGHPELFVKPVSGAARRLTTSPIGTDAVAPGHVAWSPDGRTIAFDAIGHIPDPTCTHACLRSDVYGISPDGTRLRRLVTDGSGASWSHDGRYLAYNGPIADDGTTRIIVAAADGSAPRTIAAGYTPVFASSMPHWSPRADILAYQLPSVPLGTVPGFAVRRADGTLLRNFFDDEAPVWSPNGKELAAFQNSASRVVVLKLAGGSVRTLMMGYALRDLSWSPDGSRIALFGTRQNRWGLIIRDALSGRLLRRVPTGRYSTPPAWSADGSTIYVGG